MLKRRRQESKCWTFLALVCRGRQVRPRFRGITTGGGDSHDPRFLPIAAAKARFIVKASQFKAFLERFNRPFEFFFRRHGQIVSLGSISIVEHDQSAGY